MAFFVWNDSYSVQVKAMDDQHKKLIAIADNLHTSMKTGQGNEVVGGILSSLVDYTLTHFSAEEKLMQQYGYPGYLSHKMSHDSLIKKVQSIRSDHQAGKVMITVELMNFLKSWLVGHIQGEDQKYGSFIASKGAK